ncbi:MAG TPA: hypothetical protein PK718_08720 [Candidatus Methanofastidiosa archaeon]|nr:hypothetical protein [Candidatus Methanofastidiosa archaeon]
MTGKTIKVKKGDCFDGPECSCGSNAWKLGDKCIECTNCGNTIESKGQIEAIIKDESRNCGFGDFLIGGRRSKGVNCGDAIEIRPEED